MLYAFKLKLTRKKCLNATNLQMCEGKKINNLTNLTGHTAKDDYVHKHTY
jgi:hypothetical protein